MRFPVVGYCSGWLFKYRFLFDFFFFCLWPREFGLGRRVVFGRSVDWFSPRVVDVGREVEVVAGEAEVGFSEGSEDEDDN